MTRKVQNSIADFRAKHHVTQAWVAEHLVVDVNTIARWERGELEIRHPVMLNLALQVLKDVAEREVAARVEKAFTS
jgi:DNA-binding transcriptional regulator YiaG